MKAMLVGVTTSLLLAGSAQAATIERRYDPFTIDRQPDPTLRITERFENADCSGGSAVTGRVDAWRCVSANLLMDPCFESPSRPVAVCPTDPHRGRVALLEDPLFVRENANTHDRAIVWAVRTAGRTCRSSSGARDRVRGRVAHYFCRPDFRTSVWGPLDRRRANWRALVGSSKNPKAWRWRDVTIAWR